MRYAWALALSTILVGVAGIGSARLESRAAQEEAPRERRPPADGRQAQPRSQAGPAERNTAADPPQRRAVPRAEAQPQERAAQRRATPPRREPPRRVELPRPGRSGPHVYHFSPIDVRLGFYYHPYFGFYYGPYYGPYYPYPGPFVGPVRYRSSAIRTRVKPVETEVYINGYYAGVADDFDGVFQRLYVPAGEHVIELRLEGYSSFERRVYISAGDTFDVTHQMQPLPAGEAVAPSPVPRAVPDDWSDSPSDTDDTLVSPYGILTVRVEPADAQIYVDGEAWSAADGASEFVIHLPAGWHQIQVRKEGHEPFSARLELSEGQTTRLGVQLDPLPR